MARRRRVEWESGVSCCSPRGKGVETRGRDAAKHMGERPPLTNLRNNYPYYAVAAVVFAVLSVIWTVAATVVDVQPVGPNGTQVGFATLNSAVFNALGTNDLLDKVGDVFLIVAIAVCVVEASVGIRQIIKGRGFGGVQPYMWCIAGVYFVVLCLYLLFGTVVINYRPTLQDGMLEASFPSSHTMAVITVMGCACVMARILIRSRTAITVSTILCVLIMIAMPASRLLAGAHWLTDIIGAIFYGLMLVFAYAALTGMFRLREQVASSAI